MKIDTQCIDRNGVEATVTVDLDYVNDADELRTWIENELYTWCLANQKSFDNCDFVVVGWREILEEVERRSGTRS